MVGIANPRLENLVASLALALVDEGTAAVETASGLAGSATAALMALDEFLEGANVGRLAEVLGLTHSGAVRVVGQLETAGLATRRPGRDRRQVEVELTARGRRTAARTAAARRDVVAQALSGLAPTDAAELERLLARVVETRVTERLSRRIEEGVAGAWWCRMCDFEACGRPEGRCPAQTAAQDVMRGEASDPRDA